MNSILLIFSFIKFIATLVIIGGVHYKVHLLTLCRVYSTSFFSSKFCLVKTFGEGTLSHFRTIYEIIFWRFYQCLT